MTTFAFPSETAPAFPGIALTAPDSWQQVVYPGTLLAVAAPEQPGKFTANVVVTVVRHAADYQMSAAAQQMDAELAGLPNAELMPATDESRDDVAAHSRTVAFEHPEAGNLVQAHVLVRVPQGLCADFVHITGSCGGARVPADYETMIEVVNSAALSPISV